MEAAGVAGFLIIIGIINYFRIKKKHRQVRKLNYVSLLYNGTLIFILKTAY